VKLVTGSNQDTPNSLTRIALHGLRGWPHPSKQAYRKPRRNRRAETHAFLENVWEYLRGNKLSRLVWDSYDAIVTACKEGWDFLINDPDRIRSIGHRDWACVNVGGLVLLA
jgi:hypothetical protein